MYTKQFQKKNLLKADTKESFNTGDKSLDELTIVTIDLEVIHKQDEVELNEDVPRVGLESMSKKLIFLSSTLQDKRSTLASLSYPEGSA